MKNERETADKMAARAFAQSYLDDLVPSVFSLLVEQGFFFDAAERGLYNVSSLYELFHTVNAQNILGFYSASA